VFGGVCGVKSQNRPACWREIASRLKSLHFSEVEVYFEKNGFSILCFGVLVNFGNFGEFGDPNQNQNNQNLIISSRIYLELSSSQPLVWCLGGIYIHPRASS